MDSMLATKGAPSSPWAARFPLEELTYTSENKNHSFFAPKGPRIGDPKYYDQRPLPPNFYRPLALSDLDKLFWTEAWQCDRLSGIETWKIGALNRWVGFSPETGWLSGGHRPIDTIKGGFTNTRVPLPRSSTPSPILEALLNSMQTNEERDFSIYLQERIEIDELRWLPFLHKRRWFDWIQVDGTFDSQAKKTWSVDDPKLWGVLRVSLELLDRMLDALIEDKHEGDYWRNIKMFGPPPSQDATVLLSYVTEQMISQQNHARCIWDFIPKRTSQEWRIRLVKLLEKVVWAVARNPHSAEGTTNHLPNTTEHVSHYSGMIIMSPQRIEILLNSDLTLAERCMGQVDLAFTLCRDLRADEEFKYLDGSGVAEAGHFMENYFTGGTQILLREFTISTNLKGSVELMANTLFQIMTADFTLAYVTDKIAVPPMVMVVRKFPWPGCTNSEKPAPYCPELAPGAPTIVTHVPSTWSSMLLSESFWSDPRYRKSDNFFHRNSIFVSEGPNDSTVEESRPRQLPPQAHRYPRDELALNDWNERQRIWDEHRQGWYAKAFERWARSPWAFIINRQEMDTFAIAFERRDLLLCTNLARGLVETVTSNVDTPTFINCLPVDGRASTSWVPYAIGLLMMASIPRLRMPLTRGFDSKERMPEEAWALELTPGEEASAEGYDQPVYIPIYRDEETKVTSRPIPIYDRLRGRGRIPEYTQFDCLRLVEDMLIFITERGGIVHKNMLDAIVAAKNAIRLDRQDIEAAYPAETAYTSKWSSSWMFKFPPYTPIYCRFRPDGMDIEDEGFE
ncbi:hypothetical protein FHL15_007059 [Xylaria flabelliformis]|uniref:Uncharacterized protein n=1 Tax=Xylaria flabelliformis TaxID=2512241 RepID=A0A553HVI3_9PEZI|nr:hypothetical protein FHL15_007059 [Xylaria flabelliformis]